MRLDKQQALDMLRPQVSRQKMTAEKKRGSKMMTTTGPMVYKMQAFKL